MEDIKLFIQKYVQEIEAFLTSVLLEETDIEITSSDLVGKDDWLKESKKTDIYIYSRDEKYQGDIILVLDDEWYGLLSSIMLGVEEKTNNEITRDLLKKFSGDLIASLKPKLEADGQEVNLSDVQIFTKTQLSKELSHKEYSFVKMEVDGLADHRVKAGVLVGNPDAIIKNDETAKDKAEEKSGSSEKEFKPQVKPEAKTEGATAKESFEKMDAGDMESLGAREEVISARNVEFDEFLEHPASAQNGDSRSMDLLKDVKMDISVELGRIELPLGKVLQLAKGSVIELEKLAGEPVDIMVNGHYIAKGEVVVIDEHFGVRISSLVTTRQRLAGLK